MSTVGCCLQYITRLRRNPPRLQPEDPQQLRAGFMLVPEHSILALRPSAVHSKNMDGNPPNKGALTKISVGIAADHGGFELKQHLAGKLREAGYRVIDFGDDRSQPDDDYPDFVIPLARAVAGGEVDRGVAVCGSGVGASVAAGKVAGVRRACP